MKSREKTRQVLENWSQQLEHKQVPKSGTESGVRKGKRSLLACNDRSKRSNETTCKVMKYVKSLIGWGVTVNG